MSGSEIFPQEVFSLMKESIISRLEVKNFLQEVPFVAGSD